MSDDWNNNDWNSNDWGENQSNNDDYWKDTPETGNWERTHNRVSTHDNQQVQGYEGYDRRETNNNRSNNGYQPENNAKNNKDAGETKKPSKLVQNITATVVMLALLGFLLLVITLTKKMTGADGSVKPENVTVTQTTVTTQATTQSTTQSSTQSTSEVTEVKEDEKGTSESSSDLGGSEATEQKVLEGATVSSEILENTGTVKSVKVVVENELLVSYHVDVAMGSTVLPLVLNYEQAGSLAYGDRVKVQYSIVEGQDRVVVRSIQKQ